LQRLIEILEPNRDGLERLQRFGNMDFFCGLFGGEEPIARFEVAQEIIQRCSQLDVAINLGCYPPLPTADQVVNGTDEFDDDSEDGLTRAFAYLAMRPHHPDEDCWPDGIRLGDRLPRPVDPAQIILNSDLAESEPPLEHIARVMGLLRYRPIGSIPPIVDLICCFAGYGRIELKRPILHDLAAMQTRLLIQLC